MNIKATIKSILYNIVPQKNIRPGLYLLNMHYIRVNKHQELKDLSTQFESFLQFLLEIGTIVDLNEYKLLVRSNPLVKKPVFSLTFDDGFEENYTVIAPILKKFKITASFFIISNFNYDLDIDDQKVVRKRLNAQKFRNALSIEQLENLSKDGHIIGAHSATHPNFKNLDEKRIRQELIDCKTFLETIICKPVSEFAYPYGNIKFTSHLATHIALGIYENVYFSTKSSLLNLGDSRLFDRIHVEPFWSQIEIMFQLRFRGSISNYLRKKWRY